MKTNTAVRRILDVVFGILAVVIIICFGFVFEKTPVNLAVGGLLLCGDLANWYGFHQALSRDRKKQ